MKSYLVVDDYVHEKRTMRPAIDYSCGGRLVIPSKLGGKKVTSIANSTFFDCVNLKKVEIPKSVTNINGDAFGWCRSLEEVTIPKGVV